MIVVERFFKRPYPERVFKLLFTHNFINAHIFLLRTTLDASLRRSQARSSVFVKTCSFARFAQTHLVQRYRVSPNVVHQKTLYDIFVLNISECATSCHHDQDRAEDDLQVQPQRIIADIEQIVFRIQVHRLIGAARDLPPPR